MRYPEHMAPEMRELFDAFSKAIVPKEKRKAVVRTNWHVPYYSRGRYTSC